MAILLNLVKSNRQSSLFHCTSPFLKLPFYMLSSTTAQQYVVCRQHTPRGLLFDAPSHHIQYQVKQVGDRIPDVAPQTGQGLSEDP